MDAAGQQQQQRQRQQQRQQQQRQRQQQRMAAVRHVTRRRLAPLQPRLSPQQLLLLLLLACTGRLVAGKPEAGNVGAAEGLSGRAAYVARFGECKGDKLSLPALSKRPQPPPTHPQGGCDYGSLPGYWNSTSRMPGVTWRVLSRGCETRNLLPLHKRRASGGCPGGPDAPPKLVLLLGDSVDREFTQDVAKHLGLDLIKCRRLRIIQPDCGDVVFATIHLYGVSPVGPWHYGIEDPYMSILPEALEYDWRGEFGLPDPDMVIINSNMWDLSRAWQLSQANLTKDWDQRVLPGEFVADWVKNATDLVDFVRGIFPNSVLGWHTIAPGVHNRDATGTMRHMSIGKRSFSVQLNAAGRMIAQRMGLVLVDYEALVAGFHDWSYLKDNHHPTDKVQLEVANLYLNLVQQLPLVPPTSGSCLPAAH